MQFNESEYTYYECRYRTIYLQFSGLTYRESCRLSATYDLWLKAESWRMNFKIKKKIILYFRIQ